MKRNQAPIVLHSIRIDGEQYNPQIRLVEGVQLDADKRMQTMIL